MQIVMHQGKKTVNKNAVFLGGRGTFLFYLILNGANKNKNEFMKMSVYKGKVQPFFRDPVCGK